MVDSSLTAARELGLQTLREACPTLELPLLEEILDTFQNYAENEFDESEEEEGEGEGEGEVGVGVEK